MKSSRTVFCLAAIMVTGMARGDGKMYWREAIPPNIPYQRALILFKDGTQTLLIQSKYEISKTADKPALGWVIPVPSIPEVASMSADDAHAIFFGLRVESRPQVTQIRRIISIFLSLGLACISIILLVLCLLSFFIQFPPWFKKRRGVFIFCGIMGFLLLGLLMPLTSMAVSVGLIAEHHVGIYDVQVVRSNDANDLISWLNQGQFRFGEEDKAAFDSYLSRGWCFVVAHINPSDQKVMSEGLAVPLVLRFRSAAPVYPVALTGTGGHETEILIYLASDARLDCGGRLTLRYAGERLKSDLFHFLGTDFKLKDLDYPYLCKFRDALTPAQMKEDIVFSRSSDNEPYREHIVRW